MSTCNERRLRPRRGASARSRPVLAPLALLLAVGAGGSACVRAESRTEGEPVRAGEPPNLLFILADDHTSQAWGCYGGRLAQYCPTPNIDRIAAEGARLTSSFCTNSICVPSRATILTGQYSHANGVRTLTDALEPERDHVAKRLQAAGYETALVGKWHLKEAPSGFDYWSILKGQGRYHDPVLFEMDLGRPEVHEGHSTDVITDEALDWLRGRDASRPFCLMLHFKAPHEPWNFHPRYADLYADVELPEPETLLGPTGPEGTLVPGWPLEILTGRQRLGDHGDGTLEVASEDPDVVRRATYQKLVKDLLRCVAGIDDNIGRVLDHLDQAGLADRTVVIYTSDQGYFLGEHNYFDKRFMLEESLRMPFVVRYPPEIAPGTVLDDIVLNVDFAELLLDYAGAPIPPTMQGRSFRANLAGRTPQDWRDEMYYRYYGGEPQRPAHFGIRTASHKLIFYDGLGDRPADQRWELYDLLADPHETRNVHAQAAYAEVIADLEARLAELQHELGDAP